MSSELGKTRRTKLLQNRMLIRLNAQFFWESSQKNRLSTSNISCHITWRNLYKKFQLLILAAKILTFPPKYFKQTDRPILGIYRVVSLLKNVCKEPVLNIPRVTIMTIQLFSALMASLATTFWCREGSLGCLLHQSPKFFSFVSSTALGTILNFECLFYKIEC